LIPEITTQEFENKVLRSPEPVLVDFHATWCMPCRMLAPVLEKLSQEFAGRVKFVKVNVDEEYALAATYEVSGVPTLKLFQNGVCVETWVGLRPPREIQARLEAVSGNAVPSPSI